MPQVSYRGGEPSNFQVSSLLALMPVCLQTVTALPFTMLTTCIPGTHLSLFLPLKRSPFFQSKTTVIWDRGCQRKFS